MDRDRRGNLYDPDVTHMGRGESYRPGGGGGAPPFRPGPSRAIGDTWLSDRRNERRDDRLDDRRDDRREERWDERRDDRNDERREDIDSYVPPTSRRADRPRSRSPPNYRRRSRTPPGQGRDERFLGRPRSPRRFSPRRDDRPRSPMRRRSRSPYNSRPSSPPTKRAREDSPPYNRRSSPPLKRERLSSSDRRPYNRPRSPPRRPQSPPNREIGPRGYRRRSRTPEREERRNPFNDDNWRRRSPSPGSARSGPVSGATSRRSSPPIHPDRLNLGAGSRPRSPAFQSNRSYDSRQSQPLSRPRSPIRRERSPPSQRSPLNYVDRTRAPSSPQHDQRGGESRPFDQPPTGPGGYRGGNYNRASSSVQSRGGSERSPNAPPSGPASSSVSMSAHNRPNPGLLSAPTRPRGAPPGRFDGPPRDFSAPAPRRGSYGGPPPRGSSFEMRNGSHPGGRGGFSRGGFGRGDGGYGRGDGGFGRGDSGFGRGEPSHRPSFGREDGLPPFRSHNNSSSSTYPRTQRFNNSSQHLSAGEKIIPGGKLAPSGMNPDQEKRIRQLEEAAEKMRDEIEQKQKNKREVLREWDVRQRESEREGLRSELAERHLEKLTEGEDGAGASF